MEEKSQEKPINRWIKGVPAKVWATFSGIARAQQKTQAQLFADMVRREQENWVESITRSGGTL